MEYTKSNVSPKNGEKKNVFIQMIDLWKKDVNWKTHADKDRKVCIWFAISFCSVLVFCNTWLVAPAVISLICSLANLNDVKVEE